MQPLTGVRVAVHPRSSPHQNAMWGSVETTVKLGLTGLAGFTLACVVIETAGTVIGTAVAGSSDGQNYFVTRTVWSNCSLMPVWPTCVG